MSLSNLVCPTERCIYTRTSYARIRYQQEAGIRTQEQSVTKGLCL